MNYTTLVGAKGTAGSIKSWIAHASVPSTDILTEAESEIYRHLRTREMRASTTVTIADAAITAALPTGFIDPIRLVHRDNNFAITLKPDQDLQELRTWDTTTSAWAEGIPSRFAIFDELLQFDVTANAAYTCKLLYYKTPTALSGANETNWLTTRYPRLLRVACLRAAADFMENMEKFGVYDRQVKEIIQEINVLDDLSLSGADPSLEYRDHG